MTPTRPRTSHSTEANVVDLTNTRGALWLEAFRQRIVWRRASMLGFSAGFLQAILNQGDLWWRHAVDGAVVAKTIASPLVTFSVALISAAGTYVDKQQQRKL